MFRKIVGEEVNDAMMKAGGVGMIAGILTVILAEEKTTLKDKVIDSLWAVLFAIFTGLVMKHLGIFGISSDYLEWAAIGFVSFNQKAIRTLSRIVFIALTNSPFETMRKIKDLFKKD